MKHKYLSLLCTALVLMTAPGLGADKPSEATSKYAHNNKPVEFKYTDFMPGENVEDGDVRFQNLQTFAQEARWTYFSGSDFDTQTLFGLTNKILDLRAFGEGETIESTVKKILNERSTFRVDDAPLKCNRTEYYKENQRHLTKER